MKKIFALILMALTFAFILCSCGGADIESVLGTYKIEGNIYYSSLANTAYNPTDKYLIEEADGKVTISYSYVGISGEEAESTVGELKKLSLKKANFDKLIFGEAWQNGLSAESIRKENKGAWCAESKSGEKVYVLLQNDGSVYAVSIKTKDGLTSCAHIRKLSALSE